MSNVIKAYAVRYEDEIKKTIAPHAKPNWEPEKRQIILNSEPKEGFVEGLNAAVVEDISSEQEISGKAAKLLESAKNEADAILQDAGKEAEQIKKDAYSAASKKGYEEGKLQAKRESDRLASEYSKKAEKLQTEYETMAASMEPKMAQIIAELVEKITGVMTDGREEVILYLIDKAVKNLDKSNEFTIRVSKDDFEYVSARRDIILGAIGRDVSVNIAEDAALTKNQCLIETDLRVINCSLDVQLNNLITDIKLLGGI